MNRKYKGYLITVGLLIIGYVITHFLGISDNLFKTYVAGLTGMSALFFGANIAVKKINKINGGGGKID